MIQLWWSGCPGRIDTACMPINLHCFGDDIDIFEARAGIKDHDSIGLLEHFVAEQVVVGSGGCGSFRREQNAFVMCPVEQRSEDDFVGKIEGLTTRLGENLKNDGIAEGLGDAQA